MLSCAMARKAMDGEPIDQRRNRYQHSQELMRSESCRRESERAHCSDRKYSPLDTFDSLTFNRVVIG
jgi:hypothetical protein